MKKIVLGKLKRTKFQRKLKSIASRFVLIRKLRSNICTKFLVRYLHKDEYWHLSTKSVARACFIGMFWMMIPMPMQMVASTLTAIVCRANISIALILIWISNPFTWAPIYYGSYRFGCYILDIQVLVQLNFFDEIIDFHTLNAIILPLYLGSIILGLALGVTSFCLIYIAEFLGFKVKHKNG